MRVAVPNLCRIDAFPCGGDDFVSGEVRRQRRKAGIPQALLRPKPPRGEAGDGGATGKEA
jgi:hypothetical protein